MYQEPDYGAIRSLEPGELEGIETELDVEFFYREDNQGDRLVVIDPSYYFAPFVENYTQAIHTRTLARDLTARGVNTLAYEYRNNGTRLAKHFCQNREARNRREAMAHQLIDWLPEQEGTFWEDAEEAVDLAREASKQVGGEEPERYSRVGISMGGTIASKLEDDRIERRVAVNPFFRDFEDLQPSLTILYSSSDEIALPEQHAVPAYQKAPEPRGELIADIGGDHLALLDLNQAEERGYELFFERNPLEEEERQDVMDTLARALF